MEKIYCSKCGKECSPEGFAAGYGVIPETGEKSVIHVAGNWINNSF